jgi:hypothetical protein
MGVGTILLVNLGGAANVVIRRLTSRNLGELAPGYAASPRGLRAYATLILALGLAVAGVGVSPSAALAGVLGIALGVATFAIASVIAITGELRTYRALPRPPRRD